MPPKKQKKKQKKYRKIPVQPLGDATELWTYFWGGDGDWWLCQGVWAPGANNVIGRLKSREDAEAICAAHNDGMQLPLMEQN